MIDAIRRAFRPIGRKREAEAETLNHAMRNRTQVIEAERFILAKERQMHWLEKALTPPEQERDDR
jgi:hypothetical protein